MNPFIQKTESFFAACGVMFVALSAATCFANSMGSVPAADVQIGRDYQVIDFSRGSDQLTAKEKSELKDLISAARSNGMIDRVHIVAWSDKPYPVAKDNKLEKIDRELAKKRIDAIDLFLRSDLDVSSDIKKYSMAEHSSWFGRALNTRDAELKSLFSRSGGGGVTVRPEELVVVKEKGAPMKAVVLVQMKGDTTANGNGIIGTGWATVNENPAPSVDDASYDRGFERGYDAGTQSAMTQEEVPLLSKAPAKKTNRVMKKGNQVGLPLDPMHPDLDTLTAPGH